MTALGLRGAEAAQAGESLSRWERRLEAGQRVTILRGTKGRRRRESEPADRAAALETVRETRAVAETHGGRLLDAANLRRAMTWYHNVMNRQIKPGAEITSHCLRYAYAADRIAAYVQEDDTRAEALTHTSVNPRHGDGRGRYVEAVYTK